jgi:ubiquinone/menaquinone biosynthesis C-methylase UbiE
MESKRYVRQLKGKNQILHLIISRLGKADSWLCPGHTVAIWIQEYDTTTQLTEGVNLVKKTDYAKIASTYDENKERLNIPKDLLIESQLSEFPEIRILDIGCGTGNYLSAQQQFYKETHKKIQWIGIDPSPDMLSIAVDKCADTQFIQSEIETIPPFQERFHLITSHFSFHHFIDKHRALKNIARSIENNGIFKYQNIVPEYMSKWWVYHYFPESYFEDQHRFWDLDLLTYELGKYGFETTQSISITKTNRSTQQILDDSERRDTSQLAMIEDRIYFSGLKRIKEDSANGITQYPDVFAMGTVTAKLRPYNTHHERSRLLS